MATNKLVDVKNKIQTGDDGDFLISNAQTLKSGRVMIRGNGSFGTATVSVGFIDDGAFRVVKQADGTTDAIFTAAFALEFGCGKQLDLDSGPAISVATTDGATLINLIITRIGD